MSSSADALRLETAPVEQSRKRVGKQFRLQRLQDVERLGREQAERDQQRQHRMREQRGRPVERRVEPVIAGRRARRDAMTISVRTMKFSAAQQREQASRIRSTGPRFGTALQLGRNEQADAAEGEVHRKMRQVRSGSTNMNQEKAGEPAAAQNAERDIRGPASVARDDRAAERHKAAEVNEDVRQQAWSAASPIGSVKCCSRKPHRRSRIGQRQHRADSGRCR